MVFGFGFNKTKVLASAEKNVKQGKLQNAITDYERVLAEDPKDLTVMNTVGDIYARVGNTEKATEYFRKIGNAYATEGFTVRAIAMYKKLTKQNPGALDAILKLGELYTQQGLHNDARTQFMLVAEQHLRNNELQPAAAVLQKTLELDPENSSLQTRLAELYVKIGRAGDARDLYFRNAEALRARGSLDLADDALGRVLTLDPNYGPAMLLRGQVKFESGDPENAIQLLEQLPDIDSRPEGLRTLLKSKLTLGQIEAAEPIARKLLSVFNDPTAIADYGEALIAAGSYDQAVALFSEHASIMLSSDQPAFMQTLQSLTARVKTNPRALEQLCTIFQRAGNSGHVTEITELLAHACVQQGDLTKARDLYQRLTTLEPENPQHAQNFRQIVGRITDQLPTPKQPEPEHVSSERSEPDDTDSSSTTSPDEILPVSLIEQKYPGDISELLDAALTDAELFDSYNLASKAIAHLEIILPRVPNDVRVNQRLASLYARAGRLHEAAERFQVLERIHVDAGFLKDSRRYAELAAKYLQRAGSSGPLPAPQAPEAPSRVPVSVSDSVAPAPVGSPKPQPEAPSFNAPQVPPAIARAVAAPNAAAVPPPVSPSQSHEIDLSAEWEEMLEVESAEASSLVVPPPIPPAPPVAPPSVTPAPVHSSYVWDEVEEAADPVAEIIDEIRFYIAQSMWPEAGAAVLRCEALAPGNTELAAIKAQLAVQNAPAVDSAPEFELISDARSSDFTIEDAPTVDPLLMPATAAPAAAPEIVAPQTIAPASPVAPAPKPPEDHLVGLVHDLEASLGEDFSLEPKAPTRPADTKPPVAQATTASIPNPVAFTPPAPSPQPDQQPVAEPVEPTITPDEERNALTDIFAEFKESMESGSETQEDPETHYNLGVAFKEMDLFDEAIGEFQKVCQSIERGHPFAQPVQAFTWLADCFLKKGVPDLAIRWYERALKTPRIDYEIITAIRYELACACETAGDRSAALRHFMEVYGTNIDYRDVAERIKSLRS